MVSPLVCISVPTFEREPVARVCLESLKNQTYQKIEVAIYDNSKSEDIKTLVDEIGDERFRYERNDPGISEVLINNHRRAFTPRGGKYHMVLTSDYALDPSAIEKLVYVLENNKEVCAVTAGTKLLDPNTGQYDTIISHKLMEVGSYNENEQALDSKDLILAAFKSFSGVGFAFHTMVHSSLLENRLVSDIYFNQASEHQFGLELLMLKSKIGYINEPLNINIKNSERYSDHEFRSNARFSRWVCRELFFNKHYAELNTRNFPIFRMRIGMMNGYFRSSLSRNLSDSILEPLLLCCKQLVLLLMTCVALVILSPILVTTRVILRRKR